MHTAASPALDRASIERAAHAVRALSDTEVDGLLAAWRSIIGLDLVMSRWMLRPDEREAFDHAADAVRAASDDRVRAARRAGPLEDTAHEKLAELALGHLVVTAWSDRLSPEQKRRMGGAWRVVTPKRTAA